LTPPSAPPSTSFLSSDDLVPEPTSGRLLAALSRPVRLFITVTLTFSILGGLLQVLGSTRGPLARGLVPAVTIHVAGNLIASGIAIALVVAVGRIQGHGRRISVRAATVGGAIGGAARLPLELLDDNGIELDASLVSVLTEAGWFLIAALLTNIVARLARNEQDARRELGEALRRQTDIRTQMLNADMQTRREVAEWLHGHLQAELLVAAEEARRMGPEGEDLAIRLAHLRNDELRNFAHTLHPTLAELNLFGALQELVQRYRTSMQVTVTADEATVREPLSPSIAVAAYRSCEEAVANALKHGGARKVHITLAQDRHPGHLTLAVDDDGCGVPEGSEPGLGLTLIDTYVRAVDGTWDLQGGAEAGATLSVSIPLHAPPPRGE